MMKRKINVPVLPKLPKSFKGNLEAIVREIQGRPLGADFAREWRLTKDEAFAVLQYLFDVGMINLKWIPEKHALCIIRLELPN